MDLTGVGGMQYARGVQCFVKKVNGERDVDMGITARSGKGWFAVCVDACCCGTYI